VHIDVDTYAASKFVLNHVISRVKPRDVIIFDEYMGIPGWKVNEHLAWRELVLAKDLKYEYLAFSEQQVALRVL